MTKNDPCCLYESGGDYDDDYCYDYQKNEPTKSTDSKKLPSTVFATS